MSRPEHSEDISLFGSALRTVG